MTRFRDKLFRVNPKHLPKGTSRAKRRKIAKNARLAERVLEHVSAGAREAMDKAAMDAVIYGTGAVDVSWQPGDVEIKPLLPVEPPAEETRGCIVTRYISMAEFMKQYAGTEQNGD